MKRVVYPLLRNVLAMPRMVSGSLPSLEYTILSPFAMDALKNRLTI
jgi:hypothetical protein